MPYNSNSDLPDSVRTVLPNKAQTVFRNRYNVVYDDAGEEQDAMRAAWAAVKEDWHRNENGEWVAKSMQPKPLYIYRQVLNPTDIVKWAKDQGFETVLAPDDLHVTVLYSKKPVDWLRLPPDWSGNERTGNLRVSPGGARVISQFNDAVVLQFTNDFLKWRHQLLLEHGGSHDYDYSPHVTLTYNKPDELDINTIEPYTGDILLGPEIFEDIDDDYKDNLVEKFQVLKTYDEQRIVYGWASVITRNGNPVIDLQGEVIKSAELVRFTADFMESERTSLHEHQGQRVGTVIHSFPIVDDIAKSLGLMSDREGWIVGVKVNDENVWKGIKSGELRGFSVGGSARKVDYAV